ncbi:MAG: PTS transporter subunit EIIC [Atopobiaceae bacterium]|jgi:PTS system beta-glucosides-specific IIC component|nr:PTS transporter subunit EIIC [Atopobiaceae bacterium]
MAGKYDALCRTIIQNVGGKENVISVAHCITRLRFKLKDESKANDDILEETPGVIKVMHAQGQYQVVVGQAVDNIYDALLAIGHFQAGGNVDPNTGEAIEDDGATGEKKGVLATLIDIISGIIAPTLGCLSAAGILKGVCALIAFLGMPKTDGVYQLLYAIGDGFFYFLPIALGYTAAKKFKCNEFVGMLIGMALVYPTMVNIASPAIVSGAIVTPTALGTVFAGTPFAMSWYSTFLGLPVIMPASGYTSSVIPIIVAVWLAAKVEHWFKPHCPDSVRLFLLPLVTLVITVPLTYLVIGPISGIICGAISLFFQAIIGIPVIGGALLGLFVGALWQVLVIFGFHWALIPIAMINWTTLGFDNIIAASWVCSFGQIAAVLAIMLKTKDQKLKDICYPAFITGIFGVTEPSIYGVTLPKKTPFIMTCIGGAAGGAFAGAMGAVTYSMGGMSFFMLPVCINPNATGFAAIQSIVWLLIGAAIATVVSFVLTWITYKDEPAKKKAQLSEADAA